MSCPRSITFTIPGKLGVGVQVTVVEDAGNLDFTVDVLGTGKHSADLRRLFFQFDETALNSLQVLGGDGLITGTQIQANSVINLGQGVNMNGAASPFDVGIAFGTPGKGHDFVDGPVHFTLDAAQDLTLDDIAHLQFGARLTSVGDKITAIAPAAPDARDDSGATHEDVPVVIDVLANDTDADGDHLVITDVEGAAHGTVSIVDNKVVYTPFHDYAGLNTDPNSVDDSFTYCVSDGHGGQDSATVNLHIVPVADQPHVGIQVLAAQPGDPVNEIRLHITANQTDVDGSEFIDRLLLSGLPGDVIVAGGGPGGVIDDPGQPGSVSHDVQLFLPTNHSSNFDFGVTAFSDEIGNGDPDEASATQTQHVQLDVGHFDNNVNFQATDQSIWDSSHALGIDDDRFIGFHSADSTSIDIGLASAGGSYDISVGFQSTLHATLGNIDATLPFDVTLDTLYNRTTDTLQINPSDTLEPGASFTTEGPGGSYSLDFVFNASASAFLHNPIDDLDVSVGPLDLGFNIFSIDSATLTKTIDIPPGDPVATLTLNFPTVNTTGAPSGPSTVHSDGTSPDIVNLDVDAIALALAALGITPNPLDLGFVTLLSLHVNGGINVLQHFDLSVLGLTPSLVLEDGTSEPFTFGSPLTIANASSHDVTGPGGVPDGQIGVSLQLTPDATLRNETDLGFHVGADLNVLDFGDPFGALFSLGGDLPLGDFSLFDNTFALNFLSQHVDFAV
jgi:hypothetical protein